VHTRHWKINRFIVWIVAHFKTTNPIEPDTAGVFAIRIVIGQGPRYP